MDIYIFISRHQDKRANIICKDKNCTVLWISTWISRRLLQVFKTYRRKNGTTKLHLSFATDCRDIGSCSGVWTLCDLRIWGRIISVGAYWFFENVLYRPRPIIPLFWKCYLQHQSLLNFVKNNGTKYLGVPLIWVGN